MKPPSRRRRRARSESTANLNRGMERFEIQSVLGSTLPEAASFLHRQLGEPANGASFRSPSRLSIERRLRWLLLGNPVARDDLQHGFYVRDSSGVIRGLTLCFPGAFLDG